MSEAATIPTENASPKEEPVTGGLPKDPRAFAILGAKEKAIFKKQEALKAEIAQIKAQKDELAKEKAEIERFKSSRGEYRLNPAKLLEDHGLTFRELNDFFLNDSKPTPDQRVSVLQQEMEAFKKAQEEERERNTKESQERLERERSQAVENYKVESKELVKNNPEKYELILAYGKEESIYDIVEEDFKEKLKTISFEEASRNVLPMEAAADKLEKELEEEIEKALSLKKILAKGLAKKPEEISNRESPPASASTRTISNSLTSSSPSLLQSRRIEDDRMARAMAALTRK